MTKSNNNYTKLVREYPSVRHNTMSPVLLSACVTLLIQRIRSLFKV